MLPSTVARLERPCNVGESLFEYPGRRFFIVSTDFIKSDRRREEFQRACPELVMFAQLSIKVDEVARELGEIRAAIGAGADVAAFTREALSAYGSAVSRKNGSLPLEKPIEIGDKTYSISHRYQHSPVHLVSFRAGLDERPKSSPRPAAARGGGGGPEGRVRGAPPRTASFKNS